MSKKNWSDHDMQLDDEFKRVIEAVDSQKQQAGSVPPALDRKIKRLARQNVGLELQQHWIFSNAARLTLGMLLFFAIAMIWLSL